MKKITLLFLFFVLSWHGNAQTLTIGTGTFSAQGTDYTPVSAYYASQRYQVVYTAAELAATMTPYDEITGLGFSISQDYGGGSLLGYSIKIGHTAAVNASTHITTIFTEVKAPFDYDPAVQSAGAFDMIAFDVPFVWNGVENIVIDICTDGPNPYTSPYGGVRGTTMANGGRVIRSDDNPMCDVPTTQIIGNRPNISFTYTEGTPPSCVGPITLSVSSITSATAVLNWVESGTATAWNIEYGEQGFTQGTGTVTNNVTNAHPISLLEPQTNYQFYVQSICESSTSSWSGPYSFRTLCDSFDSFTEGFDSTPTNTLTECWKKKIVSPSSNSYIYASLAAPHTGAKSLRMGNSDAANAVLYAITPSLTALPLGTHQIKFFLLGAGATVQVGTMTDPNNENTFTMVATVPLTENYTMHTVTFSAPTTDTFVAFRAAFNDTYYYVTIDDIIWEAIPATVPACVTDLVVALDPECGNYATKFSWDHVEGVDGYKLLLGTTTGGTDILTEITGNLGYTNSFSYEGNYNSTYFYKLIPYNVNGDAVGCLEGTFTTVENGCHCISAPEGLDGLGITDIQIGANEYEINPVTYTDHTGEIIDFAQGLYSNLQITFDTEILDWGFVIPYDANVWIDFNDNYAFEPNELLFSGTSSEEAPTTLNASFTMSATAALGQHRLRIGSSFTGEQETPDPCYSGPNTFGVTVDYTVNIVAATCTPPVATTEITPDCEDGQFFVALDVTELGNGSPLEVIDGDFAVLATITAVGPYNIGPFENASSVSLKLKHTTNALCDVPLGTFTYTCPPTNDTCATAIDLGSETSPLEGTTVAATNNNLFICNNSGEQIENEMPDVYYSIAVPVGSSLQIGLAENPDFDSAVIVFYGDCDNRTPITCFDDPDDSTVTWANNTAATQTVYWVQDAYSGTGSFTLEWSLIACTSADVTFTVNSLCNDEGGDGFEIVANITNLGTATSLTVSDGMDGSIVVTAIGPVTMGPYDNDTDVQVTVANDQNGDCSTVSPTLTQMACPPSNDNCANAIALIPGSDFSANAVESSVVGATDSSEYDNNIPDPSEDCDGYDGGDIWYTVEVPADGKITIETGGSGTNVDFDSVLEVYSGTCGALTYIDCDDDSAAEDAFSMIELTGRTPGEILYIRVWGYGNDEYDPFTISVWNADLSTQSFDNENFRAYPNPVKDILHLSYTQNITNVEVFNLLGQQVKTAPINANLGTIDMSNLASGTYLVKINTEDKVKTLKIIKE